MKMGNFQEIHQNPRWRVGIWFWCPGGLRQKPLPPASWSWTHTAMKITESCRCQTCEVKAVRVCTSTPKKNRSIVWMILLVLWCFLVQSPAGNSAFNNINLYELEWSGTWVRWEAYGYFKKNLDIRGYTRICLDILRSQTQIGITDL